MSHGWDFPQIMLLTCSSLKLAINVDFGCLWGNFGESSQSEVTMATEGTSGRVQGDLDEGSPREEELGAASLVSKLLQGGRAMSLST